MSSLDMTHSHQIESQRHRGRQPEQEGIAAARGECVQAFILLGGGLTPSPLTASTRCSVLDLLIGPNELTVFDRWMNQVGALNGLAADDMPIIIANGGGNFVPQRRTGDAGRRVEMIVDRELYRGAAGVVCDVSRHMDDGALLLVAEAARAPDFDLAASVRRHKASGCEATVIVNPDNTPAGIYLMARRLLNLVQHEGYMDLKEQWLDRVIQADGHVGVHRISDGYSRPLRTRSQLLNAARAAANGHVEEQGSLRFGVTIPTRAHHGFRCAAPDARIDESAVVVDSIIMRGASVGPSSIVTRSIVCANCDVPADAMLVDAVQGPGDVMGANPAVNGTHREYES